MADRGDPFDFGPPPEQRRSGGPSTYGHDTHADHAWDRTAAAPLLADPFVVVRTPVVWFAAAIVLGIAGAVLAAVAGGSIVVALGAWALAGPVAIGLLAVHSVRDTALRTRLGYDERPGTGALYIATVVVVAVGIALSAWRIAEWAGRL